MITNFTQQIPTRLIFGCGSISALATEKLPGSKALIVISSGTSMRKYGYLASVTKALAKQGVEYEVFDKIQANPIKEHVMEGAALARNTNCDFVIGLGGGSSIDSAKSIALMAVNSGDYWDYVVGGSGKGLPPQGALPVIAIPTTAGTGTEIDPWTVITYKDEKIGYGTSDLFPQIAVVDPELMTTVPAKYTAFQGFDAFFHAAEGYIASIATPISDLYALKSISLLAKSLPRAVADGSDIEARTDVALASTLSGMVEATSCCTSEHSMEHAMSAVYGNLPHGAGLIAISLAYFSRFVNDHPAKYKKMAEAMTGNKAATPKDFLKALATLQKQCGVDDIKLSDYGIKEDDIPRFIEIARRTVGNLFALDPHLLTDEEVFSIYKDSYK
ncbi:MAG: iron-containing alcohol dehydrogenase [Bacteroidetes bacterium]|uniref:Iron-containing alcohol dehydrogenase n=1 Tax=Candidatus Caccoplasma merdipullorum TaxID=2840718 RepID=A0A9D9E5S0_9BACT|nr:iron-containing alcohol dehydrogenase [Candidatus Caccoplasma merdipullorum]